MKIFKKLIFGLGMVSLIIIILFSLTLFIIKHLRIKEIVETQIEHSLGINVTIEKIEFSPLLAHIGLRGVTIHNPQGFIEDELAYLESLHFVVDPLGILVGKNPHIFCLAVNLKRLNIEKNKSGKINLKELIPVKDGTESIGEELPFYFDVVIISIDKVKYTDYSSGAKKEHLYNIGIKEATLIGLKDEDVVVKMIIYKALENTDIGKLINLTIVPVFSAISDTMDATWGAAKTGAKGAWEIATLPIKLIFGKN